MSVTILKTTSASVLHQEGFMILQEAMRVRPVASTGTTRYAKHEMTIGGHLVPKGTILNVPFDAVHHFPGNWPHDTDAFIPV